MTNQSKPSDTQDFGEERTYTFTTRDGAWAFMRNCDAAGWDAGYPSLGANSDGYYTVRAIRRGWSS